VPALKPKKETSPGEFRASEATKASSLRRVSSSERTRRLDSREITVLTRRRCPDRPDCWHVYYGDVHVGVISIRTGSPHEEDLWGWSCGFYPGSEPGRSALPALQSVAFIPTKSPAALMAGLSSLKK
jgi:hypothetical protein